MEKVFYYEIFSLDTDNQICYLEQKRVLTRNLEEQKKILTRENKTLQYIQYLSEKEEYKIVAVKKVWGTCNEYKLLDGISR